MDGSKESELITQFCGIAGVAVQEARFYLEANEWDLDAALTSLFEAQKGSEASTSVAPTTSNNAQPSRTVKQPAGRSSGGARVKTFQELMASKNDDQEETEKQTYFAGGEKSGVMMEGGPKDEKKGAFALVKDILSKAVQGTPPPSEDSKKKAKQPFKGRGNRLGAENEVVSDSKQEEEEEEEHEIVERNLTFWRNGFSIDDGPLLKYDDPQNEEFLKAINSGRAPQALLKVAHGQRVEVKVTHRMQDDFQPPPKKPVAAFSGTGNRLGSIVPGESVGSSAATPPVVPLSFSVDVSLPVTSIQIRLADGTRLVSKFNHSHTVADIRWFIAASRPQEASRSFILQTMMPVKPLTDLTLSIKDAGLLNSVVVQRYI